MANRRIGGILHATGTSLRIPGSQILQAEIPRYENYRILGRMCLRKIEVNSCQNMSEKKRIEFFELTIGGRLCYFCCYSCWSCNVVTSDFTDIIDSSRNQ